MEKEYRILEPEVAGGFGEETVLDYSTSPATVQKLHYEFQGWLGDELLTTTPCFIVSLPLKDALIKFDGTGYSFGDVTVSKSTFFESQRPEKVLPQFAWLRIHGQPGRDDTGLTKKSALVVSDAFLDILRNFNIQHCIIRRKPYRQQG